MGAPQQGKGQGKFHNGGQNKHKGAQGSQGGGGKKAEDWKKKKNQPPQQFSEKPKFVKGEGEGGFKKEEEKKKTKLSFGDSDGEEDEGEPELKINQKYAKEYEQRKKNQELSQLNSMYGSDEEEESSESEVEDEDGDLVTPALDTQILRTISLIKERNPAVYDSKVNFFSEEEMKKAQEEWEKKKQEKKAQPKPVYLKDYQRQVLLEDGGIIDEEAELPKKPLTYVEEQKLLKEAFSKTNIDSDASDDEEDFFSHRVKTTEEIEEEDRDFKEFLFAEKKKDDEKKANDLEALKRYWTDPNLSQDEKFLRDYVLERSWIEKHRHEVAYNEEEDSESELEETEDFERKINFRHEEEGAAEMTTFARDVPDSLRRKDTKRAEKRKADKDRKDQEKEKKKEELKRLKNLKKKEILEKLKQVEQVSGASALGFENVDLDGDFDPEEHDRKMREMFDDDYYQNEADLPNPEFLKDDLSQYLGENTGIDSEMYDAYAEGDEEYDQYEGGDDEEGEYDEEGDDGEIFMDADYMPGGDKYEAPEASEEDHESSKKKQKAAKNLLAKLEGKDEQVDKLLDEYYQLNYEDFAGGKPTRFKYRKVEPTGYGLTPVEILLADDKDLNSFISLKKLAPYRPHDVQARDKGIFSRAKRVKAFRQSLLKKIEEEGIVEKVLAAVEKTKKDKNKSKSSSKDKKGKKEGGKDKGKLHKVQGQDDSKAVKAKKKVHLRIEGLNMRPSKKEKKKEGKEGSKEGGNKEKPRKDSQGGGGDKGGSAAAVSEARLKSYGIEPSKKTKGDHHQDAQPFKKAKSQKGQ